MPTRAVAVAVAAVLSTADGLRLPLLPERRRAAVKACDGGDGGNKWTATSMPRNVFRTPSSIQGSPGLVAFGVLGIASQLFDPLLIGLSRLGLISLPPMNAFAAISNAAMEQAVASGEVPALLATAWAQRFSLDLYAQYFDAGAPADFVGRWCADAGHAELCKAAEAAAAAW